MRGRCRFCGCTQLNACPEGCWWINRAETVCSSCDDVEAAWRQQQCRPPNMTRAFAHGYFEGLIETASNRKRNPYAPGRTARFWDRGHTAALQERQL